MKLSDRILIIDDEEDFRAIIAQRLIRHGYVVLQAATAQKGLEILTQELLDVVLLDLRLPDGNGLDVLQEIKKIQADVEVIMLTGHGSIESAIEAMKQAAFDYLTKPCNLTELEMSLRKALERRKLQAQNNGFRQVVHRQTAELQIIAESQTMRELIDFTHKIAASDAAVLIQGESGTGKELIAKALHSWSKRSDQPYVPLNAGAIPEALMESELFGHEKGAFTGAGGQKLGLVEVADRGTLFLDEIGEMPMALQVKLLRFLETGEFRRIGDTRLRRVDVRILTATNRNLEKEIDEGHFRRDLFYRLNSLNLEVPPLRSRREDILPLANFFMLHSHNRNGQKYSLSADVKKDLLNYDFPGNVRELRHLIERGMILATGGVVTTGDLWPGSIQNNVKEIISTLVEPGRIAAASNDKIDVEKTEGYPTLWEMEKRYILDTLDKVQGNRTKAAQLLGISVRNLYRKIAAYECTNT